MMAAFQKVACLILCSQIDKVGNSTPTSQMRKIKFHYDDSEQQTHINEYPIVPFDLKHTQNSKFSATPGSNLIQVFT